MIMNPLLELMRLQSKIHHEISKNQCNAEKEVGDKVVVWDGSYNKNLETGEKYAGIDEVFDHPLIIVKTDADYEMKDLGGDPVVLDIVVYSKDHNKKIAIAENCIRLAKDKEVQLNKKIS